MKINGFLWNGMITGPYSLDRLCMTCTFDRKPGIKICQRHRLKIGSKILPGCQKSAFCALGSITPKIQDPRKHRYGQILAMFVVFLFSVGIVKAMTCVTLCLTQKDEMWTDFTLCIKKNFQRWRIPQASLRSKLAAWWSNPVEVAAKCVQEWLDVLHMTDMGVSINAGIRKWMVYNGTSYWHDWLRGSPILGILHIVVCSLSTDFQPIFCIICSWFTVWVCA